MPTTTRQPGARARSLLATLAAMGGTAPSISELIHADAHGAHIPARTRAGRSRIVWDLEHAGRVRIERDGNRARVTLAR